MIRGGVINAAWGDAADRRTLEGDTVESVPRASVAPVAMPTAAAGSSAAACAATISVICFVTVAQRDVMAAPGRQKRRART